MKLVRLDPRSPLNCQSNGLQVYSLTLDNLHSLGEEILWTCIFDSQEMDKTLSLQQAIEKAHPKNLVHITDDEKIWFCVILITTNFLRDVTLMKRVDVLLARKAVILSVFLEDPDVLFEKFKDSAIAKSLLDIKGIVVRDSDNNNLESRIVDEIPSLVMRVLLQEFNSKCTQLLQTYYTNKVECCTKLLEAWNEFSKRTGTKIASCILKTKMEQYNIFHSTLKAMESVKFW
jgi:hypothetical protein